jgi:hypothetical protein
VHLPGGGWQLSCRRVLVSQVPHRELERTDAMAYHNEEAKDDSDDFVGYVFYEWQKAMGKSHKFQAPDTMTDDEIAWLGVPI